VVDDALEGALVLVQERQRADEGEVLEMIPPCFTSPAAQLVVDVADHAKRTLFVHFTEVHWLDYSTLADISITVASRPETRSGRAPSTSH
jgi:hypothetical protein